MLTEKVFLKMKTGEKNFYFLSMKIVNEKKYFFLIETEKNKSFLK